MAQGVKHRRGTDEMRYLDVPVPFRVHGHDCLALVVDDGRVFARWFDRGVVHLAWVQGGLSTCYEAVSPSH